MPVPNASFGIELRRRRVAAGLSLATLAARVHYSTSQLSKVETGRKAASPDLARRCDAALAAEGALAALVPAPRAGGTGAAGGTGTAGDLWVLRLGTGGAGDLTVVPPPGTVAGPAGRPGAPGAGTRWGAPGGAPRELDPQALAGYRSIFDTTRWIGQSAPPAVLMPALVAHTHALASLAGAAPAATRPAALLLAARFAEYAGWIAQESGHDDGAIWWTDHAVELALAAGDRELAEYAYVRRALIALYRHDPVATVELAQRALAGATDPRVRSLASQAQAQGHALAGDYDQCRRALDAAAVLAATGDGSAIEPVIGTASIADQLPLVTGWCLHDLGQPAQAVALLEPELARIPAGAHRARARFAARLALALASMRELEQACAVAEPILDTVASVDSATVRAELRTLARTLNRWHGDPAVRRIAPRLAAALHRPVGY